MCQSNVYLIQNGKEKLLLEEVILIEFRGKKILLKSIFGEEEIIEAKIKTIDLFRHRIILEKETHSQRN